MADLGITAKAATKISDAIDDYVKELNAKKLNLAASSSKVQAAIKGTDSVKAVSTATGKCNTAIDTSVNLLKKYKDTIKDIASKYATEDKALGDNIVTSVTNSMKS